MGFDGSDGDNAFAPRRSLADQTFSTRLGQIEVRRNRSRLTGPRTSVAKPTRHQPLRMTRQPSQ